MDANTNSSTNTQNPEITFAPNVAALLSYLITPVTGLLFLYLEKNNKFVRFHAAQSVVFGVTLLLVPLLQGLLVFTIVGILIIPIISVGAFIMWVYLMFKAYNNETYEIPYLATLAKQLISRF